MSHSQSIINTSMALLAASLFSSSSFSATPPSGPQEKCFGVSNIGENDCSGKGHACVGLSTLKYDAHEFKYVPSGTCKDLQNKISALKSSS